jgi:hypothetical protein
MNDETNMTSPAAQAEMDTESGQRRFEDLPPAAQRALEEARERRRKMAAEKDARKAEIGGRGGKDPARYGDWEIKGVAVDF